jgi:hypothetical protein
MDNPYYIDSNGILVKGTFYTGQTFTDHNEFIYYQEQDHLYSITSVSPDGQVKDVII